MMATSLISKLVYVLSPVDVSVSGCLCNSDIVRHHSDIHPGITCDRVTTDGHQSSPKSVPFSRSMMSLSVKVPSALFLDFMALHTDNKERSILMTMLPSSDWRPGTVCSLHD